MTDSNVNEDRYSDVTSSSLLVRAKQDDPEAWDRIVEFYGEMVYRWCRASGLSPDAARDVGQDVFLAAYRGLPNFVPRHRTGSFRAWLRTITRSKVIDYSNKTPAELRAAGGSDRKEMLQQVEFPQDDEASAGEDLKLLYGQVENYIRTHFSESHCDAFFRVSIGGEDPAEVAATLGMTRNAVYLACGRIRKQVRGEFADLLGDEVSL